MWGLDHLIIGLLWSAAAWKRQSFRSQFLHHDGSCPMDPSRVDLDLHCIGADQRLEKVWEDSYQLQGFTENQGPVWDNLLQHPEEQVRELYSVRWDNDREDPLLCDAPLVHSSDLPSIPEWAIPQERLQLREILRFLLWENLEELFQHFMAFSLTLTSNRQHLDYSLEH